MIRAFILALALLLAVTAGAEDVRLHPLLAMARDRAANSSTKAPPRPAMMQTLVATNEHAIERSHVPPAPECAQSIGARRFADLYLDLAQARSANGDYAGAAQALRDALACRPRAGELYGTLASTLFVARDYGKSREAAQRALDIDPRSIVANRQAGLLDFIADHWPEAIGHFRYTAGGELDRTRASYDQLMLWLAQRRAGVVAPELVARTPTDNWPRPLLQYLRGESTESELIAPISEGDDDYSSALYLSTSQRLCEALYYVGEEQWARGTPELAREYFAAVVGIRDVCQRERSLALAELGNLRGL